MISEDLKAENEKLKSLLRKIQQEKGKEGDSMFMDDSVFYL